MQFEFNDLHDNANDSQLIVAITGTPEYIIGRLQRMLDECKERYGKPIQGHTIGDGGNLSVTTPIWKGKTY